MFLCVVVCTHPSFLSTPSAPHAQSSGPSGPHRWLLHHCYQQMVKKNKAVISHCFPVTNQPQNENKDEDLCGASVFIRGPALAAPPTCVGRETEGW